MSDPQKSESSAPRERDPETIWTPPAALGQLSRGNRLEGLCIIVIGAGQQPSDEPDPPEGNGRAIALACARQGAAVACVDRNLKSASETAARIEREQGRGIALQADVTDAARCEAVIQEAHAQLGGLHGVVVNVGTGLGRGLAGTDLESWDKTMSLNLRAHFVAARTAMPLLPTGGSILFIGSIAGLQPGSGIPAYDASKAALLGLSRHVALEGARKGVRSNVIVPGLIDTPLGRMATRHRPTRGRTPVPLGRQGTAWEVALAAVFLLSPEASYVTAQVLAVDGGLSTI